MSQDTGLVPQRKSSVSGFAKTALKIIFAVALIAWMVREDALSFNAFKALSSPWLVAFCIGCGFAQIFINNYRWLLLLRGQGFETTVQRTLKLTLIGTFFNFAMPGGVGGDVVKGYYMLQHHPDQRLAAAVSIFMDRLTGFFIMIATAFTAVLLNSSQVLGNPKLAAVGTGVTLLFFGFVVFYAISLSRLLQASWAQKLFATLPGGRTLHHIYSAIHAYRKDPRALLTAMAVSVLGQAAIVAFVIAVAHALGESSIPLSVFIFIVPVGLVVQALPISPAGIGVGQAAFYFMFNLYLGHESQLGPTAMTVMQMVSLLWGLVGAYFYLTLRKPAALAAEQL